MKWFYGLIWSLIMVYAFYLRINEGSAGMLFTLLTIPASFYIMMLLADLWVIINNYTYNRRRLNL